MGAAAATAGLTSRSYFAHFKLDLWRRNEAIDLFEYEDELGKCYIGSVGGMPERMNAFYYADHKYEFCFYADRKWEGNEFDVVVTNATILRLHGSSPHSGPDDFDRIGRTMGQFFSARWFLSPGQFLTQRAIS